EGRGHRRVLGQRTYVHPGPRRHRLHARASGTASFQAGNGDGADVRFNRRPPRGGRRAHDRLDGGAGMNLEYPPEAEEFRGQLRAFLAENVPDGFSGIGTLPEEEAAEFIESWRRILYDNGLLAPAWPKEYGGGGLTPLEQVVLAEEFARAGVPTG